MVSSQQTKPAGSDLSNPLNPNGMAGLLTLLTTIFFINITARIIFAPLMPDIETDLNISHSTAGSLFFLISTGYFVMLLCSGWFAAGLNHHRTITLSTLFLGLALVGTAFSSSLWAVRLTLLLLGAAAGLYLPSGIAVLTTLVSARHRGKAIAVHEVGTNLGFVAAPLFSELIMAWFNWRSVTLALGVVSLLLGSVFARYGRGGAFSGTAPSIASFKSFLKEPVFWIMAVLFGLGIGSTLGIYTMLPLYLVTEHGIDRDVANTVVAFSRVSGLFMALVGGWASDRYGPCRTMTTVFFLTGLTTVAIGVTHGKWILVSIFLQPAIAVCFFPAGFAILSTIGPADSRNIAVSLAIPAANIFGGGAIPVFIGYLGDAESFSVGIVWVGGLITLGAALAYFLESMTSPDRRKANKDP
jgi:NNP family nitrate/nitrite transporter-like MFS transporter